MGIIEKGEEGKRCGGRPDPLVDRPCRANWGFLYHGFEVLERARRNELDSEKTQAKIAILLGEERR